MPVTHSEAEATQLEDAWRQLGSFLKVAVLQICLDVAHQTSPSCAPPCIGMAIWPVFYFK